MKMTQRAAIGLTLAAWTAIWCFWFVVTRSYHPTLGLALIVTTALVTAYALASYVNQQWLIPRCRLHQSSMRYLLELIFMMLLLTCLALTITRGSYNATLGPDPDANGAYKHFAIDFIGMSFHVAAAAAVVRLTARLCR